MDDFEDSFQLDNTMDDSDGFSPKKQAKKAAAKKSTTVKPTTTKKASTSAPKKAVAPKSDKAKAPAKPRVKKAKVAEDLDEGISLEMDRPFEVLETPQESSDGPSPPRPTILQESNAGGSKKNASETYQKVLSVIT